MPESRPRHAAWWPPATSQVVLAVGVVVTMVVNTIVMWSDAVAAWWSTQVAPDDDAESVLPAPIRAVLEARPDLGDAELHAVAWSVPAFLVVLAVLTLGGRWNTGAAVRRVAAVPGVPGVVGVAAVVAVVWAWSVTVEVLQPVVSDTRGFEWIDVAGNSVGVAIGAAVAAWWRSRRRRAPRTNASGDDTVDEPPSTSRDPAAGSTDLGRP